MKTKEELNAIKEEVETMNKKLAELNDEEMAYVSGGSHEGETNWFSIPGPVDPLIQKQSGDSREGDTNWFSIPGPVDPLIQKQGDANPEN